MHTTDFSRAFQRIRQPLWAYAVKLTRSARAAAVLVRETESRAALEFNRRAAPPNFNAWIFSMLRNTHLSTYRRTSPAPPQSKRTEGYVPTSVQPRSTATGPGDSPSTNISQATLRKYLNEIEPKYSRPFTLYYTGYTYEEISRHLDLPLATIKERVTWTRQRVIAAIREQTQTHA